MEEVWKDIPGYEGRYFASNFGRIKSRNIQHKQDYILSQINGRGGYLIINIIENGKHVQHSVHQLVASAFIPNPENKPQVNHIDGDKKNNRVDNLEWVTAKENVAHAIRTGLANHHGMKGKFGALNHCSKPVFQFSKSGELIKRWDCISEAARFYNHKPCQIINVCAGRLKTCAGFIWRYTDTLEGQK